ncbi:nitrous oxide reductase accessory protein NosL [Natronolimnohabitans innermongolicus]|uniref:Lipoprotein NosL n=1 Tax=Natronolimnohabitans innermongolicus JCM 12255 TaxID=1227499 RepID=L9XBA1_9EURY|nr:nitrous oxide reductase accessory protein NosL [Natronolimnohabitans innermongolicus]ELY58922.1 lipoprotein NosL [Natronolimnohabitans innermongolicus JCM 12255]
MDQSTSSTVPESLVSRRVVLGGVATVSLGAIAGCLDGDDEDVPEAIEIEDDQDCDQCSMRIVDHPGPAGQAHYEDPSDVEIEDRPALFCSSLCAYAFTFTNEDDAEPDVIYLTDYSAVDETVEQGDDSLVISRHLEADAFEDATGLTMVVDSDVEGAMGASIIPFGDGDDADAFADEYGGDREEHDDITQELVMSLMQS